MNREEDLADAYLRHYESKLDQDFWAFEEVNEIIRRDPEAGWRLTRELIDKAPSDEALAYVAAGPLEDLLKRHGLTVIDQVELAALDDKRLQLALSGVWLKPSDSVRERWNALMRKFGFTNGRRTPL